MSPPGHGRSRPLDKSGSRDDTDQGIELTVPRQLDRRREAARRLPALSGHRVGDLGGHDPIAAEQAGWRDAHDVLMARLGHAEPWQRQRACEAWERGAR